MAVPKQRHTSSRRDRGRMHLFIKPAALGLCKKCGKSVRPHTMCHNCGYYKGMEIVDVLKKLNKKEKKLKEKEFAAKEKEQKSEAKNMTMEELSKK
ncbi:MAG: 50S ribosomal protein L32 [Candidatus Parcubacteria bacterium]|nr:50S ribosomal protein L32 [Candidatus Parcubacteria bacterium]